MTSYVVTFDNDFLGPEYFRLQGDRLCTVLVPEKADRFATKKKAKEFIAQYNGTSMSLRVVPYDDAQCEWEDKLEEGVPMREFPIKANLSRPFNGEDANGVLKWWIQYGKDYCEHGDGRISYEDYRTWPELYSVCDHIWSKACFVSHDYSETYLSFQIYTRRDGKYGDFKRELMKVLPHVTYVDDDGNKVLPIFDHFLSEHGNSVSLVITGKDKAKVVGRYDSRVEGSLRDCFDYMRRERYYE